MKTYIKISFLGLCLGFMAPIMNMQACLKNDLKKLQNTLDALGNKLKSEIKPGKAELNLSKLDKEALEILLAEAKSRGIPLYEFVMGELLKSNLQPQDVTQPQVVVAPVGPPPPPPPAPAVTKLPGGIVIAAPPTVIAQNPQSDPEVPSLAAILKQRGALKKTEGALAQQKKSDEQFLNAFRTSNTIDEIIDQLNALNDNPLYLKKESLKGKEKTPLPKGSISGGLQLTKIGILQLLKRKNQLIFNFFNENYLKDYMFNPSLFVQDDYKRLSDLINLANEKKSPIIDKKLISDMLFIQAFRNASSLGEIIEQLKIVELDPQYLKKESFKAALKLPITDLLIKKNKLILETMQPGSVYLKDYLFDISLFNDEDYKALEKLFNES